MSQKQKLRRYFRNMGLCLVGYLVSLFGVIPVIDGDGVEMPVAVALAAVPGLFVLGVLASIWIYLRDMDEVARHFAMRAMVFAAFAVLAVAGSWGLLELLVDDLPRLPVFYVFVIFFAVQGAYQFASRDKVCLP